MKNFLVILAFGWLMLNTGNVSAQNESNSAELVISNDMKWSKKMALSIMKRHPQAFQIDEQKNPKWDYVHGLVLHAFELLYKDSGDKKFYDYIKNYADTTIDSIGNISSYKYENLNLDMIVPGRILFQLYADTKDERYQTVLKKLRKQLDEQPRTPSGGFWHKKVYPNQMWLDGLYMAEPFYAQYTLEYDNGKYFDDIAKQFELIKKNAVDKKTGLLYHGWDESKQMDWANKVSGCSPNFWSRSIGWYMMALVDVLDYFPKDHPKYKMLVCDLNNISKSILKVQDKSGLWFQVTDKGTSEGNYIESSGSSMFIYALAKGANKGYLPKKDLAIANKAFDALIRDLIKTDPDGQIHITQACAVAGLGGKPYRDGSYSYYVNERKKDDDPKATGPFILAALELNR
jgi:unsaturated rhamnogalacturonyl hydrolase